MLLIYAEAANRANHGTTTQAMEDLNQVHRRSYGYNPQSPSPVDYDAANFNEETFFDLLLREKSYETILECKRWLDLVRTGTAAKMVKQNTGKTLNESMLLWPIPVTELNYNKAIDPVKDQNPGY